MGYIIWIVAAVAAVAFGVFAATRVDKKEDKQ